MNGSEDDYFVWPDNYLPNVEKKLMNPIVVVIVMIVILVVKVKLKNKIVLKYLFLYY